MLTEAEKKWLRNRKFETCENCKTNRLLCDRCNHIYPTNVCALDRFTLSGLSVETTYDELKDAAEFEARVAAKLAVDSHDCGSCKIVDLCNGICECERLKHARIEVEEEMDRP